MKTGLALFCLLGLGVIFDVEIWPKSTDIKPEHYSYVTLSKDDSVKAMESYRKLIHLNKTGFYRDLFPRSEQKLTLKGYIWFITDFIILIAVIALWYSESSEYSRDFVLMFLFFAIGNFFDFLITYNENYTKNISFNILSFVMYALFIVYKEILTIKTWK